MKVTIGPPFLSVLFLIGSSFALADPPAAKPAAASPVAGLPKAITTLDGGSFTLLPSTSSPRFTVLVFYSTECPISNAYSPILTRLTQKPNYRQDVRWLGLCVEPDLTVEEVREHAKAYQLPFPVATDPRCALARTLGVTMVPEAAVLDARGVIRYRGRIDDTFVARQKRNANPASFDLDEALTALIQGEEPPRARTKPVGCPLPEVQK